MHSLPSNVSFVSQTKEHTMINFNMLRIHGDNIIECERALLLVAEAFSATTHYISSPPYLPRYAVNQGEHVLFQVELFAGHGRWGISIQETLKTYGAPVREAADAMLTRLIPDTDEEELLLAIEFCSALPAGNNAWQRHGRALACVMVGVPYLIYAEIGGLELDEHRDVRAPRFPNPIVPFSYIVADKLFGTTCLPVYVPSPSCSQPIKDLFAAVFGLPQVKALIKGILEDIPIVESRTPLIEKALKTTEILANQRRKVDTIRGEDWTHLLNIVSGPAKLAWLEAHRRNWQKKVSAKVAVSQSFRQLMLLFQPDLSFSVGAADIPLCAIAPNARERLAAGLMTLYQDMVPKDFIEWIADGEKPLIVVWVTGFKPQGEDSRPDRGLVPLARMLFGFDVHILTIVSGPAKASTWTYFPYSLARLVEDNGLWQAIINLSDAIIADSSTANNPYFILTSRQVSPLKRAIKFPKASTVTTFSEHDVDSTIHMLFRQREHKGVFESMCNPPGGDWSGLSILDFGTGQELRWTSLPRVSGPGTKRPDHVIQFLLGDGTVLLLAIESKDRAFKIEADVGTHLVEYTRRLIELAPITMKNPQGEWNVYTGPKLQSVSAILSGGAFCWTDEASMERSLVRGKLDVAFAIEFKSIEQRALLHIKLATHAELLSAPIDELAQDLGGRLEVQIH
jgi:hypothetical protein